MALLVSQKESQVSLAFAFGISVVLHLILFVAFELAGRLGLFAESALNQAVAASLAEQEEQSQPIEFEFQLEPEVMPTLFVDADPEQASEEKPEETPFYAVVDAMAGDDSPEDSLDQPEIDGTQDKVLKTMDTPFPQAGIVSVPEEVESPTEELLDEVAAAEMLNPSISDQPVEDTEGNDDQQVDEGESEKAPEELAMLRPSVPAIETIEFRDSKIVEPKPPGRKRPRTLAEVRQQKGLVGEKMKQEGGAKRFRMQSTPDLLATPFGDYDSRVIQAIQQRWFDILGSMPTARNARGRVVLKFNMRSDGSVVGLEVIEDSVGVIQSLVCQKAVSEPAPYGRWPDDMRRMIGNDSREVRFSFFYN
jgi:hypothetical protein